MKCQPSTTALSIKEKYFTFPLQSQVPRQGQQQLHLYALCGSPHHLVPNGLLGSHGCLVLMAVGDLQQ